MEDSKLDMRFNQEGDINAADIINKSSISELADIMYFFGEERRSRLIAKKIFEHRPIEKVQDLVTIIKKCTPPNKRNKTMARVFQSFRIAVNDELENLKKFMRKYIKHLKTGGKIIIISFHSLEDRMVKRFIRKESQGPQVPHGLPLTEDQIKALGSADLKPIGKAIKPSKDEVDENTRSRSSVLRIAEKL